MTPAPSLDRHRRWSGGDPTPTPKSVLIIMSIHPAHHCSLSYQCSHRTPSPARSLDVSSTRRGYAAGNYSSVRERRDQDLLAASTHLVIYGSDPSPTTSDDERLYGFLVHSLGAPFRQSNQNTLFQGSHNTADVTKHVARYLATRVREVGCRNWWGECTQCLSWS